MTQQTIDALQFAGLAINFTATGALILAHRATRRAAVARGRRAGRDAARHELGWFRTATGLRLERLELDGRATRHALNDHGLMQGDRLIPAQPAPPTLFRPETTEGAV